MKALDMTKFPLKGKEHKATYHQKYDLVVRKNGKPRGTTKKRKFNEA